MTPNPRSAPPVVRLFEGFADRLLAVDLPGLPSERRTETVAFAGQRVAALPSPMRIGVSAMAIVVASAGALAGRRRVARILARREVPLVDDYVRLVRSLAYTYVWETWPDAAADGGAR